MKILVTGGAGFIGSHLVDAYLAEGHDVVVVDNLSTGKRENLNAKAIFHKADVRESKIRKIFAKEKPDIVNHHAAQINVRLSVKNPVYDAEVNILGLLNLLEQSVVQSIKKFIFISSGGAMYGNKVSLPAVETAVKEPLSPYGIAKLTGEHYLHFYREVHKLPFVSLRYANIYGPRQDPKGEAGVISIFASQMLQHETPTIYGNGSQTRDYLFVKDAVRANLLALKKGQGAYNIGTAKETSVNDLFERIRHLIGFSGKAHYAPPKLGELQRSCLCFTKAKRELGWLPSYSLEDGLKETVAWMETN